MPSITGYISTSVDDCRISLQHVTDLQFCRDLLTSLLTMFQLFLQHADRLAWWHHAKARFIMAFGTKWVGILYHDMSSRYAIWACAIDVAHAGSL